MRVIESMAESIWSWLAASSSGLVPPELADCTMRERMELSRSLTSESEPSAVAMTELARSEFLMPWSVPLMSERRRSETIRPAGSSAPRLMRRPVERRWRRVWRSSPLRVRLALATRLGTLVLIRAMVAILRDCVRFQGDGPAWATGFRTLVCVEGLSSLSTLLDRRGLAGSGGAAFAVLARALRHRDDRERRGGGAG